MSKRNYDSPTTETLPVFPSDAENQHRVANAQTLSAEATAPTLLQVGRGVPRVVSFTLAALARWHRNQTRHALMDSSDHVLVDLGIDREHIRLIDRSAYQLREPALRRWWAATGTRLDADRAARRERRRLSSELDA